MGKDKIAEIAGTIPEGGILIPETLAPKFGRDKAVEPRRERGECKDGEENPFLAGSGPLKPRRNDRDDEIDAYQRIHEPQMAGYRRKVERHHHQRFQGFTPCHGAPQGGKNGIQDKEYYKWRKNAKEAATVELTHRHVTADRDKEEGGDNHKQGDGDAAEESVIDRDPQTVGFIGYLGDWTHVVKHLAGMNQHNQETGCHTDVIDKCNAFFHSSYCFADVSCTRGKM